MQEFKLPSLGENINHGDVVRVLVAKGDAVRMQQTLLELETDKALIEVPSSFAGKVLQVKISEGDRVNVGQVLLTYEASAAKAPAEEQATSAAAAAKPSAAVPVQSHPTQPQPAAAAAQLQQEASALELPARQQLDVLKGESYSPTEAPPAAGPSTRRMARELGVDIRRVPGSGRNGRITGDDVREYIKRMMQSRGAAIAAHAAPDLPDFAQWGPVESEPLNAVRRKTAEHLGQSWHTIPLVTQFDDADITELEALRQRFKPEAAERGVHLTTTVLVLKALVTALKAYPRFNSSLDLRHEQLVLKRYYHIGVAVDTPRGLLVPALRDVDQQDLWQLSGALGELTERARSGKVDVADLRGASFSLSNQGGIGGQHFTPLVNHPEVAILGLGQARLSPVWDAQLQQFQPRLVLPLALSYDHRALDGADAARFISQLKRSLEDPERLLLGL